MKKAAIAGAIVLVLGIFVFVYFQKNGDSISQDRIKPVRVMEVSAEVTPVVLNYTGIISPDEVRNMAFKIPGRISKIYVDKGDIVQEGDILAALDIKELLHAKEVAEEDVGSARNALNFSRAVYERMENLFEQGAISSQDLEKAKLDRDLQNANYNRATVNYKNVQDNIDDAVLRANMDAYVAELLFKEGETVGAGYPVVVIRSGKLTVNAGLSENDAARAMPGLPATVTAGDRRADGAVLQIDALPDEGTRTYNAKIALSEYPFNIGAVVKIQILLGEEEGLWIPVASVMADGEDYVYVVEENRAIRKRVIIDGSMSSRVRVRGLKSGDVLVVEGFRNLEHGDSVAFER